VADLRQCYSRGGGLKLGSAVHAAEILAAQSASQMLGFALLQVLFMLSIFLTDLKYALELYTPAMISL